MMRAFYNFVGSIGVFLVKCLAHTDVRTRAKLARVLAFIFLYAVPKRRHITRTNLKLCFPHLSEKEREALLWKVYLHHARAGLDHGVIWAGTREEVARLVKFEGLETITDVKNRPLIVIAPHFVGLDAAGTAFNLHVLGVGLYQIQKNAAWDRAVLEGRMRFNTPHLYPKEGQGDIKKIIRELRAGNPFYYLPDLDYGRKESIFVPFFGVQAATLPAVSRLARVSRAKVAFCAVEMTDEGYVAHISKLWNNFPTDDVYADTLRVQQEIERWILKFPDQYLWTHRRFKTRPEGEPSLY